MSTSMSATILASVSAGVGLWFSVPSHRQELHLVERMKKLEDQLGPNFHKHLHSVEAFFGLVDKDQDGIVTHEEAEGHIARSVGGPGVGGHAIDPMLVGYILAAMVSVVLMVLGGLYLKKKASAPVVMHGKGTLEQLTGHCTGSLPSHVVSGAVARPPDIKPKLEISFNKKLIACSYTPQKTQPGQVDFTFKLNRPLEGVDFGEAAPESSSKDPFPVRFPKRYLHVVVSGLTKDGSQELAKCDVDIAELTMAKGGMLSVSLGDVVSTGFCRKSAGKFGELTLQGVFKGA